jgi:hypothetical protein
MVNFCQPSHEFTFGVDINLISYPLVLTPLIYQVRSCMLFFGVCCLCRTLALNSTLLGKVYQAPREKTMKPDTSQDMK